MERQLKNKLREYLALAGILALAGTIRTAVFIEHTGHPLFHHLRLDEIQYHGPLHFPQSQFFLDYVSTNAPGYMLFLDRYYTFAYGTIWYDAQTIQAVFGIISTLLVYFITRKAFGRGAALVSAFIFGLYWPLMVFEQRILAVSLFLLLNLAGMLAAIYAERRSSVILWIVAGVIFSASVVVRPTSLLLVLLICFWLIITSILEKKSTKALHALALLAASFLIVAPFIVHNFRICQEWLLLQRNAGMNFYIGNNPNSDGTPYARPGGTWDSIQAMPMKEAGIISGSGQDRFFMKKSFEFIKDEPRAFLNLQVRKVALLFNRYEVRATIDPAFHRSLFKPLSLPLPGFALILALAAPGILCIKPGRRDHQLVLIYAGAYALVLVATVVSSRYRVPFTSTLAILAGAGAMKIISSIKSLGEWNRLTRNQTMRKVALSVGLMFLGLAVSYIPLDRNYDKVLSEEYYYLGQAWLYKDKEKANYYYVLSSRLDPDNPYPLMGFARLESIRRNQEASIEWARKAMAVDPLSSAAHLALGKLLRQKGDKEESILELRKAVELRPLWITGLHELAQHEAEMGMKDDARARLDLIRKLRPDYFNYWNRERPEKLKKRKKRGNGSGPVER